jgi:hypothetical protein
MRDFTDSFCERCGTRYTFLPAPTKGPSLAGAKVLAKGLKNFVLSDETTMDQALSAARHDVERDVSTRVTEEFHRTFNFCMTCRQYACDKCWNPNQGACLSCAPLWDTEPIAPEEHLILRTPVARGTLDGLFSNSPVVAADALRRAANALPWPAQDDLPEHPDPNRNGNGNGNGNHPVEHEPAAPAQAQSGPPPLPTPQLLPPSLFAAPEPTRPQQRPETHRPAPPVRPSLGDAAQISPLPDQSQSWKSRDDGWTLWPSGRGDGDLTVAELKLIQAQLQPGADEPKAPPVETSDHQFTPSHTLDEDVARTAPHDADRRVEPRDPVRGAWEPESPAPRSAPASDFDLLGSLRRPIEFAEPARRSEPAHPPVIGRLLHRGPTAEPVSDSVAPNLPAATVPPTLTRPTAPAAQAAPPVMPKIAKPARSSKQRSQEPVSPWPLATPWATRPLAMRRLEEEQAEAYAEEAVAETSYEQTAGPAAVAPAHKTPAHEPAAYETPAYEPAAYIAPPRPEPAPETPVPADRHLRKTAPELGHDPEIEAAFTAAFMATAAPKPKKTPTPASEAAEPADSEAPIAAQPTEDEQFTMPPASNERWPEPRVELVARPAVEWPVADPPDEAWTPAEAPAKRKLADSPPANWPPLGASWPAQNAPATAWPAPDAAPMPAAVVAAQQSELSEPAMVTALWAESAQQVLNRGGVRACHHCALPVSNHARFCRRCGSQQS